MGTLEKVYETGKIKLRTGVSGVIEVEIISTKRTQDEKLPNVSFAVMPEGTGNFINVRFTRNNHE